jgi:two-component system, OmpR family, phosphate regulon response regulator PhoB
MPIALIVDQDAHLRRLVRQVLERAGYEVREAGTAAEVAQKLEQQTPDVIVLDCLLGGPGLGLDLLRQIRATPRTREVPVLVTTGIPEPDTDQRLRSCGASAFLLKPFSPRELVQAVALAQEFGAPQPAPGCAIASAS